jgi:hypothetical protein
MKTLAALVVAVQLTAMSEEFRLVARAYVPPAPVETRRQTNGLTAMGFVFKESAPTKADEAFAARQKMVAAAGDYPLRVVRGQTNDAVNSQRWVTLPGDFNRLVFLQATNGLLLCQMLVPDRNDLTLKRAGVLVITNLASGALEPETEMSAIRALPVGSVRVRDNEFPLFDVGMPVRPGL